MLSCGQRFDLQYIILYIKTRFSLFLCIKMAGTEICHLTMSSHNIPAAKLILLKRFRHLIFKRAVLLTRAL